MQTILTIIQTTVPALVVFATVYFLLKEYFRNEYQLRAQQIRREQADGTLPMKFTALERLSLMCERIQIPNMLMRVRNNEMDAKVLHMGLLITLQQEYEHNISQQVYTSPNLWEIIRFAKNETAATITYLYQSLPPEATGEDYANAIFKHFDAHQSPLDQAQTAIKKEASLLLPA